MFARTTLLLSVAAALLITAGCAKKETPAVAQAPATESAAPAPATEAGEGEAISTEGSVAELFARVHEQEGLLEKIIADAKLSDVHKKAFAIRDLVIAASEKSTGLSAAQKTALNGHVAGVKSLAGELDESGDSGNLAKTKSLFAQLQTHLRATEATLGIAAR